MSRGERRGFLDKITGLLQIFISREKAQKKLDADCAVAQGYGGQVQMCLLNSADEQEK